MSRLYSCDCGGVHPRTHKKRVVENGTITEMYQVWTCNGRRREIVYARIANYNDELLSFGLPTVA